MTTDARSELAISILTIAFSAAMAFGRSENRLGSQDQLELDVPVAPTPVRVGNVPRLVYELRIRNNTSVTVHLSQLEVAVADQTAERIATIKGSELCADIGHPGRNPPSEPCDISAGNWAVVYLWLPLVHEGKVPQRFLHKLTFEFYRSSGPSIVTIVGGLFQLDTHDPVVLGPPVKGGPWVAVYGSLFAVRSPQGPLYIRIRLSTYLRGSRSIGSSWTKLERRPESQHQNFRAFTDLARKSWLSLTRK